MAETDRLLDMVAKGKVSLSVSVIPFGSDGSDPLEILINTHGGPVPEQHGEWIDLCTAEDVRMKAMEYRQIDLGVSMQLPEGYYAIMAPRSSTCVRYGILQANSIGIFERDYCGDGDRWGFPAVAIRDTFIPKGSRICQFQLVPQAKPVIFKQVETLGNRDRGGWGSTGEKASMPSGWATEKPAATPNWSGEPAAPDDWKKG